MAFYKILVDKVTELVFIYIEGKCQSVNNMPNLKKSDNFVFQICLHFAIIKVVVNFFVGQLAL